MSNFLKLDFFFLQSKYACLYGDEIVGSLPKHGFEYPQRILFY